MTIQTRKILIAIVLIAIIGLGLFFYFRSLALASEIVEMSNSFNTLIDQTNSLSDAKYLNKKTSDTTDKDLTISGGLFTTNITNSNLISTYSLQAITLQTSTINTGQGTTEVYLMDQNLRSIDSPNFTSIVLSNNLTTNSITTATIAVSSGLTCSNCITLGAETEGAYVANITSGNTDITVSGLPGEGFSPTITLVSTLQSLTGRGASSTNPITLNITDGSDALVLSTSSIINLAQSSAPSTTTDRLYNVAGNLTFNGVALTGGGGILPVGLDTYTLRHNGAGWVSATNLLNDGTNVGIGGAPGANLQITLSGAAVKGLVVKGAASQSANLQEWQDSNGAITFATGDGLAGSEYVFNEQGLDIDFRWEANGADPALFIQGSDGYVGIGTGVPGNLLTVTAPTTADATTDVMIGTSATTQTGLVVQGVASQSANLIEIQNSAGGVMLRIDKEGKIISDTGEVIVFDTLTVNKLKAGGTSGGVEMNSAYMKNDTGTYDLIINGWNYTKLVAQGGSNNGDIFVDGGTTSGTVVLGARTTSETTRMIDVLLHTKITNDAAASIGLVVKGAAAQSANLQEWQDSNGAITFATGDGLAGSEYVFNEQGLDIDFRWEANGADPALFIQGSDGYVGIGTGVPGNRLTVTLPTTPDALADVMIGTSAITQKGLVIQGVASQSANLQEWQNSGGQTIAEITPDPYLILQNRSPDIPSEILLNSNGVNSFPSIMGVLWFGANEGLGNRAVGIKAVATSDFNPSDWPSEMQFFTTPDASGVPVKRMVIDQDGEVGINDPSPDYMLDVILSGVNDVAEFTNDDGLCTIDPTTAALECASDIRLKKNIVTLNQTSSLDKILSLNPVTYNWNRENGVPSHLGFVAQEVESILPNIVSISANGYKQLSTTNMIPVLVSAIKELHDNQGGISIIYNYDKLVTFTDGIRLNSDNARPECTENNRGEIWFSKGQPGEKDVLEVCIKNENDQYLWETKR